MNEMWGTTRQGRGYNIRKYWQNNIQTVLPCPNPPINTPDSSTTYNHIMMSIYTTHKTDPWPYLTYKDCQPQEPR